MASDRRAAVILLALAAVGLIVRFWQPAGSAPGAVAYRGVGQRPLKDSVEARAARLARPLARGETIDIDHASADELARLPRIGPGLAARIVAYRDEHGPFGSLDALDQVPGIGPTLLAAVRPHAAFSTAGLVSSRPHVARRDEVGSPLIDYDAFSATSSARPALSAPSASGGGQRGAGSARGSGWGEGLVSLNTATEAELIQLPGIGPSLARAILADRAANGPYRTVQDLTRVRGIGVALLKALEGRILVP